MEARTPSVSIAMATYNGQNYIERQLASLAAQTYLPNELVVTDDGSTDNTLSIIRSFAKSSPFPINIHPNESRLGYRANFMHAATLCHSDLISFCDQDDNWYPDKIAACVSYFSDPEMLLVHHNADVVTNEGRRIGNLKKFAADRPISLPLSTNPLGHSLGFTQVIQRSLLSLSYLWPMSIDHQFDHERLAHDQWFYFLASILGKIGYLDRPLAAHIQHGCNVYGSSGQEGYLQTIRTGLRNATDRLARSAEAAGVRANILDAARTELTEVQSQRAAIAAINYRRLSKLLTLRKIIYNSASLKDRLAAFTRLLTSGGYLGTWNLSGKALIKDIFVGVPLRSL